MMQESTLRHQVVEVAQRLSRQGLVIATSGNVSGADRGAGVMALTPSGIAYRTLTAAMIDLIDLETGRVREGELPPSSELPLHLAVYGARADVHAVVHTHSLYATLLGVTGRTVEPFHYAVGLLGDEVRLAPYARYGTETLARSVVEHLGANGAVLLQNHGAVTVGQDLEEAEERAALLEWLAQLTVGATMLGAGRRLSDAEMAEAREALRHYGEAPDRA
jgi:L-fuculose-phosphate aldolase